jgi:hypothetical protein
MQRIRSAISGVVRNAAWSSHELRHVSLACTIVVAATMTAGATAASAVPTPTPTPTQPSMLGVSPSASRVIVAAYHIDRSIPVVQARIAVVARDGEGIVLRAARAVNDSSLPQTPQEPRFTFVFDPPLAPAAEPYTIEATALDLGFGGSARLLVVPVPADVGRSGDSFVATWWSSGATPGVPFEKRVAPDGSVVYVSRDGKEQLAGSEHGLYPEFADDDVVRLRAMFYGHDAVAPGVLVQCETSHGAALQAKLLPGRRIRIAEIGRAAHAFERVADDPTRWFGGGDALFVDSPIIVAFDLAPGDADARFATISVVQTHIDRTCVRGFVLFQNAAQMLSVFSRS